MSKKWEIHESAQNIAYKYFEKNIKAPTFSVPIFKTF